MVNSSQSSRERETPLWMMESKNVQMEKKNERKKIIQLKWFLTVGPSSKISFSIHFSIFCAISYFVKISLALPLV